MRAEQHPDHELRLTALRELEILDTESEKDYDDIVELVAQICEVPIALVSLIDADRQWFKAETGLGARSTPIDQSVCSHVILEGEYVEIPDTLLDPRTRDNPLCSAVEGLRFYAGAVLTNEHGVPLGTLCVLDRTPRELAPHQREAIQILGRQVTRLLDLRLAIRRQELLGQEIAHRVKNSLASISAIIRMQSRRSDSAEVRQALDAVQARIGAITALHEELHQTAQQPTIDLARFFDRLRGHLRPLVPEKVRFEFAVAPVELRSDVIGTIGLVVNEFVANAAKHGLDAAGAGRIAITGRRDGALYTLECLNDGPADDATLAAIDASAGLGTRIIAASAQSIGAEAKWRLGDPGLVLELAIPLEA